jgi:hypothetical protein
MALKEISKTNIRKEIIVPGTVIRKYVSADFKERLNSDLIMRILESVGIDAGGNIIHKIIFQDGKSLFVTQAGLNQALSV